MLADRVTNLAELSPRHVTALDPGTMDLGELMALAVRGLGPMFHRESRLFCHSLVKTPNGLTQLGISPRYTTMTLLGLQRLERAGEKSPFDTESILDALMQDRGWLDNIGDIGMMLWLLAEVAPDRLKNFWQTMNLDRGLDNYRGVRDGFTMELAWFLAGLSHAKISAGNQLPDLTNLALATHRLLIANQGKSGAFGHQASGTSLRGLVRGRIGTFADQVYPIYALSFFARAFESEPSVQAAQRCADLICRVQGDMGQWWWHYDAPTGAVVRRYPVYSVHQDGMAPMALYALGKITGQDFSGPISKGLRWIYAENELGTDMREISSNIIWRRIHPTKKLTMLADDVFGMIGAARNAASRQSMGILYECRPYHLGWLLYAFAGRTSV